MISLKRRSRGKWWERTKNVALTLAVVSSVALSALIWTGTPSDITLDPVSFFASPPAGIRRTARDLLRPSAVWLTGARNLWRDSSHSAAYLVLWRALEGATLGRWRINPRGGMPEAGAGTVRLAYDSPVRADLSDYAVPVKGMPSLPILSQVYLTDEKGSLPQLVFRTQGGVFAGSLEHFSIPPHFSELASGGGVAFAPVQVGGHTLLLPAGTPMMTVWRATVANPPLRSTVDSYFADPSVVMAAASGTATFYTDGTRAVWVTRGSKDGRTRLIFQDPPVALVRPPESERLSLLAAIRFVNGHGGFGGDQMLTVVRQIGAGEYTFVFQGVLSSWPIFGGADAIIVTVKNDAVTYSERYLKIAGNVVKVTRERVLSGSEVLAKLPVSVQRSVTAVRLGYRVLEQSKTAAVYVPTFSFQTSSGTVYADAGTGLVVGKAGD